MLKIGITGQSGFIGSHLFNTLGLFPGKYKRVPFEDRFFNDENLFSAFIRKCDVIIHLAALSRHPNVNEVYRTNIKLVKQLISIMEAENKTPHVLFSSSIQEEQDNEYGKSKYEGRKLLQFWAENNSASFTGMILPNVYGPFCKPNYASFIATFCHKLTHGESPEILKDNEIKLIYIDNLINHILSKIDEVQGFEKPLSEIIFIPCDFEIKVSEVLQNLFDFKTSYLERGIIPKLINRNEMYLFNSFCCQIDIRSHFPAKLHHRYKFNKTKDFLLGAEGRVSFIKILPSKTYGNFYHTKTMERCIIMNGKARIQMRRIGTEEVLNFYLDSKKLNYLDIPVWYTHHITNMGDEDLCALYCINECYDIHDEDLHFESV